MTRAAVQVRRIPDQPKRKIYTLPDDSQILTSPNTAPWYVPNFGARHVKIKVSRAAAASHLWNARKVQP